MSLDTTTFNDGLNILYPEQAIEKLVYEDHPFLALVPKSETFKGKRMDCRVYFENPQGRSQNFARARARGLATNSKVESFELTRSKDYHISFIENEVLEAAADEEGAAITAIQAEFEGGVRSLTQSLSTKLFRDGFGWVAQVGSVSTNTITLSDANDVVHFAVGQELGIAAAATSGAARAYGSSTNGLIITGINRVTGVLTFGFNVTDATNGIPGTVANDFIFIRGDRDEGGSPVRQVITGLAGWLPDTDPTSSSFFGVDRTQDVTRLGGLRRDVSALPIEEGLISTAELLGREGGRPEYVFMNPMKAAELKMALGTKVNYVDVETSVGISFRSIEVTGPKTTIRVMSDPSCPYNRGYMLTMKTWKLYSLGKLVRPAAKAGEGKYKFIDVSDADTVEMRLVYRAQLGCHAPGYNAVMLF